LEDGEDCFFEEVLTIFQDSINLMPYDINSIMHYWTTAGGRSADIQKGVTNFLQVHLKKDIGLDTHLDPIKQLYNNDYRTMIYKPNPSLLFNTAETLSDWDCEGINRLYPLDQISLPLFQGKPITHGAHVVLMHVNSKNHLYSTGQALNTGTGQQEVTCYWTETNSSWFKILKEQQGDVVCDGDLVRFCHVASGNFLHSSPNVASPLPREIPQQEVSCYWERDANDVFRVQRVQSVQGGEQNEIVAGDVLKFVHVQTELALHSHGGEDTGWKYTPVSRQQEVTCSEWNDSNDHWVVVKVA